MKAMESNNIFSLSICWICSPWFSQVYEFLRGLPLTIISLFEPRAEDITRFHPFVCRWKPHPRRSILPIFPSSARSSTSSPWLLPSLPPSSAILALPLSPDVPQQLLPPLPPHHSPHTNLIHLLHLQSWQWSHLSPSHIARITFTIVKPASFQLTGKHQTNPNIQHRSSVDSGDGECPFAKRSSRTPTGCTSPSLRLHPLVHFTFYQSKDQLSTPRRIYLLHKEGRHFILAQNIAHHWTCSS